MVGGEKSKMKSKNENTHTSIQPAYSNRGE